MRFWGKTPGATVWCSTIALSLAMACCNGNVDSRAPRTPTAAAQGGEHPEGAGGAEDAKAEAFVREFHASPSPADWLKDHPLSLEESLEVSTFAKKLMSSGDPRRLPLARSAAMAAAVTLAGNKRYSESLQAWLDAIQAEFMLVNTGPQYDQVRAEALESLPQADQLSDADLRSRFLILAADASRFKFVTARSEQGGDFTPEQAAILSVLIDDLERATQSLGGLRAGNSGWFARAREMVVLIARDLEEPSSDATVKKCRLRLVPLLEALNASSFDGSPSWETSRGMEMDLLLGSLLYATDKPLLGRSRLESLIDNTRAADAHPAVWAEAIGEFYRAERALGSSPASLAPVRKKLSDNDARVRGHYRSRLGRLMVSEVLARAYARMLQDELFSGPTVADALAAIERDKARSLLDDVKFGAPKIPVPLATQEDQVRRALQTFESNDQLDSYLLADLQTVSLVPLRLDNGAGDALERLEASYAAANVGFGTVGVSTGAAEVQGLLGPDEAFVDYHVLESDAGSAIGVAAVVLTRSSSKIILRPFKEPKGALLGKIVIGHMQPIDSGSLMSAVSTARSGLAGGISSDKELKELYSLLISPVMASVPPGTRRLIVSPDGPLTFVSFPALRSQGNRFLIEDFAVSTVESASIWVEEKKRTLQAPGKLLGIFAPTGTAGADASLSIRSETYPLDAAGDVRFWAPDGGSHKDDKAGIVSRLVGGGAVHVSAHGMLSSELADHQAIILAAGSSLDAGLDAYEVRQMPRSVGWNIVTLGICDGGVMRYGAGDEPYGLVPAFQTAGARDVVAPMWKVNQVADRKFFHNFYAALAASDPAAAYRTAAKAFIKDGLLPRDWAGYVVVGP